MRRRDLLILFLLGAAMGSACGPRLEPPTQNVAEGDPARGRGALQGYGCGACHAIPGVDGAFGSVGPPLEHFASRHFIAGELPNEPENLVK
jgi:cytochrome c2